MSPVQTGLTAFYLTLPAAAGAWAFARSRRLGSTRPLSSFYLICVSGCLVGTAINLAHAWMADGRPRVGQIVLAAYLAVGMLSAVRAVGWGLKVATDFAFRLKPPSGSLRRIEDRERSAPGSNFANDITPIDPPAPPPPIRPGVSWFIRATVAMLLRTVLLFAIVLPYTAGIGLVYRPKVDVTATVVGAPHMAAEAVTFPSTDGLSLAGRWVAGVGPKQPNAPAADARRDFAPGSRTVVVCPAMWAGKESYPALVRDLAEHGYNVLTFDFRATGDSAGQVGSFGDAERHDVLGAVRHALAAKPGSEVYGVGVGTGAAALIAAAADGGPEGQAIAAVAAIAPFDDLSGWAASKLRDVGTGPLHWLVGSAGVPVADLHAGTRLASFSPADLVDRLAPRPLLVVHGRGDTRVPFDLGVRLFDRASQPKIRLWIGKLDAERRWVIPPEPSPAEIDGPTSRLSRGEGPLGPTQPPALEAAPAIPAIPADHEHVPDTPDVGRAIRLLFDAAPVTL